MYACVCIQTSCLLELYLFIYLFSMFFRVENSSFNLIIYHINFSGKDPHSTTHLPTHTYTPAHYIMYYYTLMHTSTHAHIQPKSPTRK